jgi:uncharacterized protein YkwD
MKKLTLATATLLSITCLGSQNMTVNATSQANTYCADGKKIIISRNACLTSNKEFNEYLNQLINQYLEQCKQQNSCSSNPAVPESQPEELPETAPDATPEPTSVTTPDSSPIEETPAKELSYQEQVVELVNAERAKAGLSALTLESDLTKAAQIRAEETVTSFSHTRPDGNSFSTVLAQSGISYRRAGENIAYGYASPEAVVDAWMHSEGHRANILNSNYNKIGVGYYQTANGIKYWSQLFTN